MSAYKPVGSNFSVTTGAASTASSPILHETQYLRVNTITADSYVNVATASSSGNDVAATSSNLWCSTLYPDVISTGKPKSAQVVGITTEAGDGGTGFSNAVITFQEGTFSEFGVDDTCTCLVEGQPWFNFTHKRVKSVDVSFTPNASSGYGRRIRVIDAYTGVGIGTAFSADKGASPRDAKLRSSLKVAGLRTASTNGQINCQQVQIVGG